MSGRGCVDKFLKFATEDRIHTQSGVYRVAPQLKTPYKLIILNGHEILEQFPK